MKKYIPLLSLLALGLIACQEDDAPAPTTGSNVISSSDCSNISSSFSADVLPILERGCSDESNGACHQAGSPRGAIISFNTVSVFLNDGSFIERVIRRKDMPPSYSSNVRRLSEAELDIIECWVEKGTPND